MKRTLYRTSEPTHSALSGSYFAVKSICGYMEISQLPTSAYLLMAVQTVELSGELLSTHGVRTQISFGLCIVSPARLFEGRLARLNGLNRERKEALAGLSMG